MRRYPDTPTAAALDRAEVEQLWESGPACTWCQAAIPTPQQCVVLETASLLFGLLYCSDLCKTLSLKDAAWHAAHLRPINHPEQFGRRAY